jgi:hypothetical protein
VVRAVVLGMLLPGCGRVHFEERAEPPSIVATVGPGYQRANSFAVSFTPAATGDLLVVAGYWNRYPDTITVSDDGGLVWTALAPQVVPSGCNDGGATGAGLWYATAAGASPMTITIAGTDTGSFPLAEYVVELAGVDLGSPVAASAGQPAPAASNAMDAPELPVVDAVAVLALFVDPNGSGNMVPGAGYDQLANDYLFYSMIEAQIASPGAITPNATLPAGTSDACWAAAAAAFR